MCGEREKVKIRMDQTQSHRFGSVWGISCTEPGPHQMLRFSYWLSEDVATFRINLFGRDYFKSPLGFHCGDDRIKSRQTGSTLPPEFQKPFFCTYQLFLKPIASEICVSALYGEPSWTEKHSSEPWIVTKPTPYTLNIREPKLIAWVLPSLL